MSARLTRNLSLIALLLVVAATTASAQTYWFETYETAVDKIDDQEREEMEDALVMIQKLVAERPFPEADVRVPGGRFVDYLPYYQQARIQLSLGNYDGARLSLRKSAAFPAIENNREAMSAVREMHGILDRRAAATP